ncbi:fumarylacetoacetate hydrolase family protein [Chiayiivirga flava]|uniref:2-keto-4-pentenoate hydratase/2-oxohepta-3-ene-1,7-dioic acid hydratase in catechol pathway n=1 Tax=Chiayiivirga flava TaxID=659595 RepID=A0A7W8D6Q5_9GAMM|nr:fumarylacetoacetate hydrolase family protein [Chiayiivirga flava]MBB5208918.1 2-keto-4-pentenoate hydratase/2-oxohepta-3-ene-1,7-dioic acid hydratase in catechol pathway [Chiayiivirga flava]
MTDYAIPAPPVPSLAIRGMSARFPVRRIYCVGRNFAEHAKEMGASIDRGTPVFFAKPADAIVAGGGAQPYPSATRDLHHEVELVVALGRDVDGTIAPDAALAHVFGYTVGLDLTRRDLQAQAKAKGLPWDVAKGFDRSAPAGELVPAAAAGDLAARTLWLEVNGERRQSAPLSDMVWSVADIVHELSQRFELRAGDLIFMGTPAGVAALAPGDRWHAGIEGLVELQGSIDA